MIIAATPEAAAEQIGDARWVAAELIYALPRAAAPARQVFDAALAQRLDALTSADVVLFICADADLAAQISPPPNVRAVYAVTQPARAANSATPFKCAWDAPEAWARHATTDRWARLLFALETAAASQAEWLILPANDAVYKRELLERLIDAAGTFAKNGLPAAVSPFTPHQHAPVAGVDIDPNVIALVNATITRDLDLRTKIETDQTQALWGKLSLLPRGMCAAIRAEVDSTSFEDDLEIDRAVRALGYSARCQWIEDPALYRQTPLIFTPADARRLIERHLHYSLANPISPLGGSWLALPQPEAGRARRQTDLEYDRLQTQIETIVAALGDQIRARLEHFGASWVDWGAYRCVVRQGVPSVEVWKRENWSAIMRS